ncbi:oligopeptide ABC transporter permease [Miniphocaeibacter halophilus]|uniref:ABC transporter permease n=1 Tax=Miniphocaeibacter halophilus TaxID=2931922 RepID=A0AC61MTW7_9FIRM|nr:oligopeptide ABC transporter permease [Miniphocaeibacter halophilus]QQK09036.1 ABC transporter permease [Miniphocaeibacter halophilus]
MWKTILRRFLVMIPQLFILSIMIFVLAQFMPGDPFTGLITPDTDAATIERLREEAGLNDPVHIQYINWIKNAAKGDLGRSYTQQLPVTKVIGSRVANTFSLSLLSLVLMYAIALPLGIIAGRYNGSRIDKVITSYNFIALAIPGFVLYLVMLLIFGYRLGWFPTSGTVSTSGLTGITYMLDRLYHMILPALCYAVLTTTSTIQYLRNEIVDAKSQDYVRTARSKGVPIKTVYNKHIFRNSLLPIAAFFGFQITGLLAGSVMIETVFAYPGMGSLFIDSVTQRDYSVMTALVLLYGLLTLIGSLVSDIIMSIVDPRIRIE